jgi:hypothetical protein
LFQCFWFFFDFGCQKRGCHGNAPYIVLCQRHLMVKTVKNGTRCRIRGRAQGQTPARVVDEGRSMKPMQSLDRSIDPGVPGGSLIRSWD